MFLTRPLVRSRSQMLRRQNMSGGSGGGPTQTNMSSFWKWTTQVRPSWKESPVEAAVIFTVFGITGSSSVALVRPCLHTMGLEGSMIEGPWSYRIGSFVCISPVRWFSRGYGRTGD